MQGLRALQRYAYFSGRSRRAEYWQAVGLFIAAIFAVFVIDALLGQADQPILSYLLVIACFVPLSAVATRRLHDRGFSGWWLVTQIGLSFVGSALRFNAARALYSTTGDILNLLASAFQIAAFALSVMLLYQFLKPGVPGANRYGPSPDDDRSSVPTIAEIVSQARAKASGLTSPPPAGGVSGTDSDPLAQIERLARMRDNGLLTDDEFAAQKAACLAKM